MFCVVQYEVAECDTPSRIHLIDWKPQSLDFSPGSSFVGKIANQTRFRIFEVGLDKNEMTGHIRVVKSNVREQLLDTGLHVFHERGFNATAVQDITEAAGVPKGSFYNHFESKEDLGAQVVLRYLESSNKILAVLRDPKLSPYARLRKYFEGLVQVAEKSEFCGGCLLGNFGAELSDQSEMIRVSVSKGFSTWSASIAGVIAEAQAEGQISKDLPASTLAAFVLNGWEGALIRARVDKSKAPLQQFVKVTFAKTLAP